MKLYTAVVLLSIAQVCYGQVCEICGEGLVVTNLDEPVPLPGQNPPLTCEELQQSGLDGQIPESQCPTATEFIFDICGCSPAAGDPTSPPVELQPPTLAPTPEPVPQTPPPTPVPPTPQPVDPVAVPSEPPALAPIDDAPTLGPGVNPPCSICGEEMRITLLDPIVSIPGFQVEPTCEEFQEAGFQGQIPASNCPFVPSLVGVICGCAPGGSPVSTPGDSPTTPPDPDGETAICHVCGEASSQITIAAATTDITGELLTCQELQTRGLAGALKRAECPFVPMLIKDICGCSEGPIAPASTPSIPPATAPTTGSTVCNICGVGNRVGDQAAVLNLPDQTVTCGDLEAQGLAGEFANGDCGTLPETIGTECQCEVDPDFTFNFTNSNSCLVCEENMELTNPDAVIQLDGGEPQTCAELQEKSIGGSITRTDCLAFPTAIQDVCGCKELGAPTMAPVPVGPPPTTTAPAPTDAPEPNCSGSQGTFGVESGTEYEMEFFYEIVTTGNTVATAIQNILTTRFEPALSAALLSGVFSSICSRRLQIGRRLDVVGISARPNDELLTNVACQTEVAAGNGCVVVRGLMTLYGDDDSGVDDKMQAALERTQVSMENGAFDSLDSRMVAIRFRTEALPPSLAPTPAPDEPTEPGLSCDASGTIGSDQGDANEVQFFYEVLSTQQTVTSALESILRTTFEPALIAALFSGLFSSVCSRRLAAAVRRRLNVIGLKAKPNDELLTTVECSTITETDGNTCTVVRGLLTLYAEDGSDITEQKQATLDRTRVSMSNGAFDNLDSRLVQVRYRSETLDESGTKDPAPGPAPASPPSVPIWAWVLIGVGIFVVNVLICCFCMRRRRQNKEAEEDDFGYGGDPYGAGGDYGGAGGDYGAAGGDYGGDASAAYSGQYSGQYEGEMEYAQSGYQSAAGGGEAGGGEFDSNDQFYEQDNGFSSMGFTQSQPLSEGGGRDSFSDERQQRGGFSNPHDMMNSIGNL